MSYEKQTWIDYPDETTPISAERLNHMEQGIEDAGESAGNIRIGYDTVPSAMSDGIPTTKLNLYEETSDEPTHLSIIDAPNNETIDKLKGLVNAVKNCLYSEYSYLLEKQTSSPSYAAYYKTGENTEVQYQLRAGNMPFVYYSINNYFTIPSDITSELAPVSLSSPLLIYGNQSVSQDDTICYIKYNGTKIPTHLFKLYGHQTMYLAYAKNPNTLEAVVVPIDTSTHEIVTNDYIGTRYADNLYSYFPFNIRYYLNTSGNPQKTVAPSNINDRPIYYKDNGSYVAYTMDGYYPFVVGYIDGVDITKYDLGAVSVTLHNGTVIDQASVVQNEDIASQGTVEYSGVYYVYEYDSLSELYLLIVLDPSGYVYATILDAINHTYSASAGLFDGSVSPQFVPITLMFNPLVIVNDAVSTRRTTYSSSKIDELIANLQSQIDALNS